MRIIVILCVAVAAAAAATAAYCTMHSIWIQVLNYASYRKYGSVVHQLMGWYSHRKRTRPECRWIFTFVAHWQCVEWHANTVEIRVIIGTYQSHLVKCQKCYPIECMRYMRDKIQPLTPPTPSALFICPNHFELVHLMQLPWGNPVNFVRE